MPKKQMKKSRKNMKGGSCGCANSHSHDTTMIKSPDFFAGGRKSRRKTSKRRSKRTIRGGVALGPASLPAGFDTNRAYSYSLNDHVNDPLNPTVQVATRQLPNMVGGGRRKRKLSRKRGGSQDLENYNKNILSSSNTLKGASVGTNIISGNTQEYDNTFKTPMFL
jgi:hypothetical protein